MSKADSRAIGIDLGSRMTKLVSLRAGELTRAEVFDTGHQPLVELGKALEHFEGKRIVATGYGRHLAEARLDCRTVTEIRAAARAAYYLCPECESVLDIGGQDSKVVELTGIGGFGRFELNDRCAAGTGRFLEVMAKALGYSTEELGREAVRADKPVEVSSTCTVFAETEVISLIAKGKDRVRIALGLHVSIARRLAAMAARIQKGKKLLFIGGVANNPCMTFALRQQFPCEVVVPDRPELAVAIGAALIAAEA